MSRLMLTLDSNLVVINRVPMDMRWKHSVSLKPKETKSGTGGGFVTLASWRTLYSHARLSCVSLGCGH
jgi:hypothetical protein